MLGQVPHAKQTHTCDVRENSNRSDTLRLLQKLKRRRIVTCVFCLSICEHDVNCQNEPFTDVKKRIT